MFSFSSSAVAVSVVIALQQSFTLAHPAISERNSKEAGLQNLSKRVSITSSTIQNQVPNCDAYDPSYASPQSQFTDGQGIKLGDDECSGGNGGKHCWTSWYIVGYATTSGGWQVYQNTVDCGDSFICTSGPSNPASTDCQTADYNTNFGSGANFGTIFSQLYDAPNNYSTSSAGGNSYEVCATTVGQGECSWNDQLCHALWKSVSTTQLYGYMRRSCVGSRPGTQIPQDQQTQRADGFYTVGMQDFFINVGGVGWTVGCGALCGNTTYPDSNLPTNTIFNSFK